MDFAKFQSTLPVGGATGNDVYDVSRGEFQSTLPVGGATCLDRGGIAREIEFQSTLPVGGATR